MSSGNHRSSLFEVSKAVFTDLSYNDLTLPEVLFKLLKNSGMRK